MHYTYMYTCINKYMLNIKYLGLLVKAIQTSCQKLNLIKQTNGSGLHIGMELRCKRTIYIHQRAKCLVSRQLANSVQTACENHTDHLCMTQGP